jgi:transposase InsO family protein
LIEKLSREHAVSKLCDALEVKRGTYYKWLKSREGKREKQRKKLLKRIKEIFEESFGTYGSRRVYEQLRQEGYRCSRRMIEKLMSKNQITPKRKRKHKSTTDSKHKMPISQNVLNREFYPKRPNLIWVSDITYVETHEGWLYTAVFIDLNSRMIVGWSMSAHLDAQLVLDAYNMGVQRRGTAPLMVHSDRGTQFASELFRNALRRSPGIQSMSRKGNCWDNAPAESFFGTLKSELIYRENFRTRDEARLAIFSYIETFYNTRRLHSSLGYLSPLNFELKDKKVS